MLQMGLISGQGQWPMDMAKEQVSALERMPIETSKIEMLKGEKKDRTEYPRTVGCIMRILQRGKIKTKQNTTEKRHLKQ